MTLLARMRMAQASKAQGIAAAAARRLSILWACLFAVNGLHLPYFPVWLDAEGLSNTAISQAVALPMLLRIVMAPAVATVADRHGIARTLAAAACAAFLGYTALGFAPGPAFVFAAAIFTGLAQGVMPSLADALTLSEIKRLQDAGLRKLDFGRLRVCASLSVLVMMLSSGALIGLMPGQGMIWLLAGIGALPALAAIWNAARGRRTRFDPLHPGTLTNGPGRLVLAVTCIGAVAMVQASHAEVYTFATLHWRALGFSPGFIGTAWAMGVAFESVFFIWAGRMFGGERGAPVLLIVGAAGAAIRWTCMSFDPPAPAVLALQAMHALSFAATYAGGVLLLGSLAGPHHRARMQGWLAAATALTQALATMGAGYLTGLTGQQAYLAMAALALGGLCLAIAAAFLKHGLTDTKLDAAVVMVSAE